MGLSLSANVRMQINLEMQNSKILPNVPIPKGENQELTLILLERNIL
jgi:hypothetical protein